jgi:hypothetical protein
VTLFKRRMDQVMWDGDPKGYYSILGVPISATGREIRTSFRKLAKQLHPDRNPDPDAPRLFRAIREAYEVLGDASRRALYDGQPYESGHRDQPSRAPGPVVCSGCGQVTAQPRFAIFYCVASAVLTFRKPVQGIFCAACGRRTALKASAISAVAGWWGILGPIDTVRTIIRNARGGIQPRAINDRLQWANAQGFLATGKPELAYALARELLSSETDNLARAAERLLASLKLQGIGDVPPLKRQWRFSPVFAPLHVILMLAAPAIFIYFFPPEPLIQAVMNSLTNTGDQSPPDPLVCDEPPSNGQILEDNTNWFRITNVMEIQNRSAHDAIIKIRDIASGKMLVSFFAAKNATTRFDRIPDGAYRIQYAFGKNLGRDCASFAGQLVAAEFPNSATFVTSFRGIEIDHQVSIFTLHSVPAGGAHPNTIGANSFNAP